ncbi:MAG: ABC transporter permease [Prevotella sp.]|nr:ABC transporter permease [Prevotella sp.]
MNTIDISYTGLAVAALLLALPLYAFHALGVRLLRPAVVAVARMAVQLFLIGFYLKYLFELNNPWINILWAALIVVVAAFTVIRRARLRLRYLAVPLFGGLFGAALVVGLYLLVFVLRLPGPFDARYFVPVTGLLVGSMTGVCVMGLSTFYDGLSADHRLYYYLLGNGASHVEAVLPFVRRAVEKAFAPCIANMAVMGIVSMPGTMLGLVLGGSAPGIAVKYVAVISAAAFAASAVSLLGTLYLADCRSFDVYGRMKNVRRG